MASFIQTHLKDMNRKTVFDLLSSVDSISRAEISRRTGISSPTVIKIVSYFQEKGLVIELGEGSISTAGRKPQLIRFNPDAAWSIGVVYEGDYLDVGFVDLNGNIKHRKRFKAVANLDEMLELRLPVILRAFMEEFGKPGRAFSASASASPESWIRTRLRSSSPLLSSASKKEETAEASSIG